MNLKSKVHSEYKKTSSTTQRNVELNMQEKTDTRIQKSYVKKSVFDKTASECASWKRKYRAKEKELNGVLKQQTQNNEKQYQKYLTLKKEACITKYENQYLLLGYDERMAKETSISLYNGDIATVFSNQNKFVKELKKSKSKEVFE